jgi:uncharacterized protein
MSSSTGPVARARTTVTSGWVRPVAVGVAAGFLSGIFGVGGGILVVPALVLVLKMEQRFAHGTSLAAVLPLSFGSLAGYGLAGDVDWPVAALLAVGALLGAWIGTSLLQVLPQRALALGFAGLLTATAVRLFIPMSSQERVDLSLALAMGLVLVGVATGVLAGLLGVGGGIVMVPAMILLLGFSPVLAKGTSVAVIVPTAIMGTWRNRSKRNADLRIAGIIGTAGIVSAIGGTMVSRQLSDDVANVLFAVLLTVVAVKLLLEQRPRAGR